MPAPPEERVKFFVFVIESPSAPDLYHRRSEGEIIRQAVELNGIGCVVKTAISLDAFEACLKLGLSEAMGLMPGFIPLLHISAHGDAHGIQLSNGHTMTWAELRQHLRPVNQAMGGSLVVCMSSCNGYAGTRMAMHLEDAELPYLALIGCSEKPTWGETAVAYATFYHQLSRGEYIYTAVEAMRVASGNAFFFNQHAESSRQSYREFVSNSNAATAQENLEQIVADEPAENQQALKNLSESAQ
jgi:hypothetical protein